MKIRCDREVMLSAFHLASAVASSRSPKPILQNVKLEVTPSQATLMATDLEMGIRVQVEGLGGHDGGKCDSAGGSLWADSPRIVRLAPHH
jgi:DNA polymerase III subunit beta